MPTAEVRVLFIGPPPVSTENFPYTYETCNEVKYLFKKIAIFRPDVIITSTFVPGELNNSDFELRKKWINFDQGEALETVIEGIESTYASNIWSNHPGQKESPLMTVYTGTYNTGGFLRDTYQSLRDQTYTNWEWSVVDDESTDGTWEKLQEIAAEDHRVHPIRIQHSGKIGHVKDIATRLANGEFLVELDHDDMLTDDALDEIRKPFQDDPIVGMVYSNSGGFFQDGSPHMFTDEFWSSRYRDTEYRGKKYKECISPNIYDRFGPNHQQQFSWFLTVGPNHVRAYRASKLKELGGYNRNLPVADDWDVFARFFLYSRCIHVDKMLYLYRFLDNWGNTTFSRNQSIQDHLELGRQRYTSEFIRINDDRMKEYYLQLESQKKAESPPNNEPIEVEATVITQIDHQPQLRVVEDDSEDSKKNSG